MLQQHLNTPLMFDVLHTLVFRYVVHEERVFESLSYRVYDVYNVCSVYWFCFNKLRNNDHLKMEHDRRVIC